MTDFDFHLPDVGEGIAEAEIIEWLVSVGDYVSIDQPIAVIETDKSQLELPIPVAGSVQRLHGNPGDVLPVGAALITIDAVGDIPAQAEHVASKAVSALASETSLPADFSDSPERQSINEPAGHDSLRSQKIIGHVQASPSTRKLATNLNVDIRTVSGTGPRGRVTAEDVRRATSGTNERHSVTPPPSRIASGTNASDTVTGPSSTQSLRGARRSIATSMTASLSVPAIMEFREVDATALLSAKAELARELDAKISITPLLVRAITLALLRHPEFNARFDGDSITQYEHVHVGIATATEEGLLVPVLHDAQDISLRMLPARIDHLVKAARARTASRSELSGGTFTVTNFGSFGTWLGTPLIRVPEVAIAGFGRITDRVVAVEGQAVVRPLLPVVVSTDHRVNDGAHLGAFVSTLETLLTHPTEWIS